MSAWEYHGQVIDYADRLRGSSNRRARPGPFGGGDAVANSPIVSRILELCRAHEAGDISATRLEREIEAHAQALEGITLHDIHRSRDFSVRLVHAY